MTRDILKLSSILVLFAVPSYSFDVQDVVKGIGIINELTRQQEIRQQEIRQQEIRKKEQPYTQRQQVQPHTQQRRQIKPDTHTVSQIQSTLTELGYTPGPIDGMMGRQTAQAIHEFEADHGLPVIGQPSDAILKRMQAEKRAGRGTTSANNSRPSFDCAQTTTPTENAICRSEILTTYDRQIAEAFASARDHLNPNSAEELLQSQRAWLKTRNACGASPECLDATMRERLQALTSIAAGSSDSSLVAGNTEAQPLSSSNALPEFFITDHFAPRQDAARLKTQRDDIVTRLEYAANPSATDDAALLLRLLDMLPHADIDALIDRVHSGEPPQMLLKNLAAMRRANGPTLTQISRLLWTDEFSRQFFLSEAQALIAERMPPDAALTSIDVRLVCSVSFGEYDFNANTFPLKVSFCKERRLDLTGRSVNVNYRARAAVRPIPMELAEARAFSDLLGDRRQVLVSSPATLSLQNDGSLPTLVIEETGPPSLHPMTSLDEILYTYPDQQTNDASMALMIADGKAQSASHAPPASSTTKQIPAEYFVLRLAPEILTEDQWLHLTQRQIQYDQNKNGPGMFFPDLVMGRQPAFAAPELVGEYKKKVQSLLAELIPSAVARLEVLPKWIAYRDGKLTSSQAGWGYLREIDHSHSHLAGMADHLGMAAAFAATRLHQDFSANLPRSLVHDLAPQIRNIVLVSDRLPRIPELEMDASVAESLFLREGCRKEYDRIHELSQSGSTVTGYEFASADETLRECITRNSKLPKNFVFDISFEFTGVQHNEKAIFLETKILGAELYDLKGWNFASLHAEDFPAGKANRPLQQSRAEEEPDASNPDDPDVLASDTETSPTLHEPDIIGIQLGMSLQTAEQIINDHFETTDAIVERSAKPEQEVYPDSVAYGNSSTGDAITLYHLAERPDAGVVAIFRTLELPGKRRLESDYRKLISEKYGLADSDWGSQLLVNDAGHSSCLPTFPVNFGRSIPAHITEAWRKGPRSDIDRMLFSKNLSHRVPNSEAARAKLLEETNCAPALGIKFIATNDDLTIHTLLVNASIPLEVMRETIQSKKENITTKF